MTIYPKLILDALATVRYPGNKKNLVEAEMVADNLRIDGMKVSFSLIFEKPTDPFMKSMVKAAETAIHTYVSPEVEVTITTESRQAARPEVGKLLPQVKNIIGVSSGKGGVGKSTVSANLAVSLAKLGYKVGLLDADIFGPSMPKMFQVEDARPYAENIGGRDLIIPIEKYGIKLLSIGFFVDPDQATLWRGGMASNALKQLIADADWGELDYFLIDLPPGTSDIHLTVVQTLIQRQVVEIRQGDQRRQGRFPLSTLIRLIGPPTDADDFCQLGLFQAPLLSQLKKVFCKCHNSSSALDRHKYVCYDTYYKRHNRVCQTNSGVIPYVRLHRHPAHRPGGRAVPLSGQGLLPLPPAGERRLDRAFRHPHRSAACAAGFL